MRAIPLLLLLASCAPAPAHRDRVGLTNVLEVLEKNRLAPGENLKIILLFENADHTVNLVQLAGDLKPHSHAAHDEVALVIEGGGTFTIDGAAREVRPGDLQVLPRGAVHAFTNRGPTPTAVVSIFSPRFDAADRIPADR